MGWLKVLMLALVFIAVPGFSWKKSFEEFGLLAFISLSVGLALLVYSVHSYVNEQESSGSVMHSEQQIYDQISELRQELALRRDSPSSDDSSAEIRRELDALRRQLASRDQGAAPHNDRTAERVPASTPSVRVPVTPSSEAQERDLVASIQKELQRLGCRPGIADGVYGRGTRRALATFLKASATTDQGHTSSPDSQTLRLLKAASDDVCAFSSRPVTQRTASSTPQVVPAPSSSDASGQPTTTGRYLDDDLCLREANGSAVLGFDPGSCE
jgi:hypothetical protein